MKRLLYLWVGTVVVIGAMAFVLVAWKPQAAEAPAKTGETALSDTGHQISIESYVTNNISRLSPVKEELGGTFYVTKIEVHGGTGTVSYEDGHNAYTADFTYTLNENGAPSVEAFKVRP